MSLPECSMFCGLEYPEIQQFEEDDQSFFLETEHLWGFFDTITPVNPENNVYPVDNPPF